MFYKVLLFLMLKIINSHIYNNTFSLISFTKKLTLRIVLSYMTTFRKFQQLL